MTLRQRIAVAVIATLVVAVVGGGVNTGLTLARQQLAEARRADQSARPAQTAKHGVVGLIVRVDGDRLVVRDRQRQLREVRVVAKTEVRSGGKRVGRSALVPGARVAAIGAPAPNRALVARLVSVTRAPTPAPRPTPSGVPAAATDRPQVGASEFTAETPRAPRAQRAQRTRFSQSPVASRQSPASLISDW